MTPIDVPGKPQLGSRLVELLLGGEEGEEEVRLLQVWLLQKSHQEIFKRFQLRLKHIQPFASK